ncbi:MAG: type II toxin-antitoxin system HicB family antitoxin [Limisphaerales bacterium]
MRFEVNVQSDGQGGYIANCDDPQCSGHGLSPTDALDEIREEIRYRMELCPCTTVNDQFVELDIVSAL